MDLKMITMMEISQMQMNTYYQYIFLFIWKSRKCKHIYIDRKQTSDCLGMAQVGRVGREGLQHDTEKPFEVMDKFTILIVVMVPHLHTYVKLF